MSLKHDDDKVVAFERARVLFIFNFHPVKSFVDYRIGVEEAGEYKIILSSDDNQFGGFDRIDKSVNFSTVPEGYCGRRNHILVKSVYIYIYIYPKIIITMHIFLLHPFLFKNEDVKKV